MYAHMYTHTQVLISLPVPLTTYSAALVNTLMMSISVQDDIS